MNPKHIIRRPFIFAFIITLLIVGIVTACGGRPAEEPLTATVEATEAEEPTTTPEPTLALGTIRYEYDEAGRLIAADYGSARIDYTYDNNGNLLSRKTTVSQSSVGSPVAATLTNALGIFSNRLSSRHPPLLNFVLLIGLVAAFIGIGFLSRLRRTKSNCLLLRYQRNSCFLSKKIYRTPEAGLLPDAKNAKFSFVKIFFALFPEGDTTCASSRFNKIFGSGLSGLGVRAVVNLLMVFSILLPYPVGANLLNPPQDDTGIADPDNDVPRESTTHTQADSRGTTMTTGDPISTATGEYFFDMNLFDLGGPIPLTFDIYYGSQVDTRRLNDGLPIRYFSNHRITLKQYKTFDPDAVFIERGLGQEIGFHKTANGWEVYDLEGIRYQLEETADSFYFMDPIKEQVIIFAKVHEGESVVVALPLMVMDCNNNILGYKYLAIS